MTDIATNEPSAQRAGVTWEWRRTDLAADYPASSWTLKYWFKKTGATAANFSITATADGADFAVTVTAATTAALTAGDYTWVAIVTKATEAFEVDKGFMQVLPRYDAASNLDDRSHARIVLDAIEAVLESRATKDQEEYTIGNRSLKRTPLEDLVKLRAQYRAEVFAEEQAENAANGKGGGRWLARL